MKSAATWYNPPPPQQEGAGMGMHRRDFLRMMGQGAAAASSAVWLKSVLAASAREGAARPNVLFIASDDLRPQLGCYGDKLVKSPNLDKLAARGTVFGRAYCQQALCSPSRISLLAGRRPHTTGIYQIGPTLRSKMPDVVTLPQHFKNNGYHARSLGKIFHVGIDDPQSWSVPSYVGKKPRYGPDGQAKVRAAAQALKAAGKPEPQTGPGRSFYAGPAFEAVDCGDDDLIDGDIAREAVEALRAYAKSPGQPFFLGVGFNNPHVPWVAPKKYFDQYNPADIHLPDNMYTPRNAPAFAASSGADFYWYGNVPKDRIITPEFGRQCIHGYLAAISYVDACVGRVVDELERLKLSDNTIIVFWGDHGYYMGEHSWWGGKHNNYEGATRAPLIVSAPGKKGGQRTSAIVEFIDIYPALVELCGLPPTPGLEGRSFAPLLDDPNQTWNKIAYSEYPRGGRQGTAIRTDRYRYVEWTDKQGKIIARELYDHANDPQENENVADRPENAAVIADLSRQLKAGLAR
jgi:iduronate 2-sulfatase